MVSIFRDFSKFGYGRAEYGSDNFCGDFNFYAGFLKLI